MRRSVYIMLFIPFCFPGTMMDVIIIHIVILFKVETRTVATDVKSAASNSTDPSHSRRAKTSDFSNKIMLSWNFILSGAQLLNAWWLETSFKMQIWHATGWQEAGEWGTGISAASFPLMHSSQLKTDIYFPSLMSHFVTSRALFFHALSQYFILFFQFPFFLMAHHHFWGLTTEGGCYKEKRGQVCGCAMRLGLSFLTDCENLNWGE